MRDEEINAKAVPYFFPTSLLALIPGLFAWQVHGIWVGLFAWCAVTILIIALGWLFLLRQWPYRWLTPARSALIVCSMILVSFSGAEICHVDGGCRSMLFGGRP